MDNITKALQDLAKAVESNDTVERVKVTITLKKTKDKQGTNQNRVNRQGRAGGKPPLISPILSYFSRVCQIEMPAIGGQNAKSIKKTVQNNRNFKR